MESKSLLYIIFIALGLIVYTKKPRFFMIYWFSARAFLFPIFLFVFMPNISGTLGVYDLYYSQAAPLVYVMAIIMMITALKNHFLGFGKILIPLILLVSFIIFQNIMMGFDYGALSKSIIEILFLTIPTLTLCSTSNIRHNQSTFIKFIVFFVFIEAFFCLLNTQGVRLYTNIQDMNEWEDNLISGTFPRYNHLTNFLTTYYLVFSISYYSRKNVSKSLFYIISLLLAIIILTSGARMSVILFFFVFTSCLIFYERKNFFKIASIVVIVYISSISLVGKYNKSDMDQSIGIERNITGLVKLFSNKSIEDNTLSLSDMVLISCYNDPLFGNGMANRNSSIYDFDSYPESIIKTDARLAFMFVEYGVIGCLFFIILFWGIFKTNILQSHIKDKKAWVIIIIYFIMFTLTETGVFDVNMLTILSAYALSVEDNVIVDTKNLLKTRVRSDGHQ